MQGRQVTGSATRRAVLLAIVSCPLFAGNPTSPRNQLCESANEFHAGYSLWADKMNSAKADPYTIPAAAVESYDPLPKLWRRVEHLFRVWVRGT